MKFMTDQMTSLRQDLTNRSAQFNQNMTHINTRLDRLGTRTPERTYEESLQTYPNPRRSPYQNSGFEPIPRRPNPELVDQDKKPVRYVRLGTLTFDGCSDPKIYLDWEKEMEYYFEWHEMTEGEKFRFAKTKLIRQAQLYWEDVERLAWH